MPPNKQLVRLKKITKQGGEDDISFGTTDSISLEKLPVAFLSIKKGYVKD